MDISVPKTSSATAGDTPDGAAPRIEYRPSTAMPQDVSVILVASPRRAIVVMNALLNVRPESPAVTKLLDEAGVAR